MQLTVSSTSMLKPILHTDTRCPNVSPPHRVLGLLECDYYQRSPGTRPRKLLQYHRPHTQHALMHNNVWRDFLRLDNGHGDANAAVFGFEFDGERTWYQLWNKKAERAIWLQHSEEMNYAPFAILAMDALVSLIPNWDGMLHQSPASANGQTTSVRIRSSVIDANQIHNLLVSDSSTGSTGQLWFLVTINAKPRSQDTESTSATQRSGWISTSL